jgi:hypothetical protein
MSPGRRKTVSEDVFRRIAEALAEMASDDAAPRTKREIERRSSLSHDAVARAFRQDNAHEGRWGVSSRFADLVNASTGRRSPQQAIRSERDHKITELQQQVSELQRSLDRYAMSLFAVYLQDQKRDSDDSPEEDNVTPIGRNRRGRGWGAGRRT